MTSWGWGLESESESVGDLWSMLMDNLLTV